MNNNGKKEQPQKNCPFSGKECEGEKCELYTAITEFKVNALGVQEQVQTGKCAFTAQCMILSSLATVLLQQAQQVRMPKQFFHPGTMG